MADVVTPELDQMFRDFYRYRAKDALGTGLQVLENTSAAFSGRPSREVKQSIFGRPPAEADPMAKMELRRRITNDMADYLSKLNDDRIGIADKMQSQYNANKGLTDLMKQFIQSDASASARLAEAKIRATVDIGESMQKAIEATFQGPSGDRGARNAYYNLRSGLAGIGPDGKLPSPREIVAMYSSIMGDATLDSRGRAMAYAYMNAEMQKRGMGNFRDVLMKAANAGDAAAARIIEDYDSVGADVAAAEQEMLRMHADLMDATRREALQQWGGVNQAKFLEFADAAKSVLEGNQAALGQLDQTVAGLVTDGEGPAFDPLAEADKMLDDMASDDLDRLDPTGEVREMKMQIMRSPQYLSTVKLMNEAGRQKYGDQWVDLDPTLDVTFAHVNKMRKRQRKEKREDARRSLRLLKHGEAATRPPSSSALMQGEGAGSSAERGSGGAEGRPSAAVINARLPDGSVAGSEAVSRARQSLSVPGAPTVDTGELDTYLNEAEWEAELGGPLEQNVHYALIPDPAEPDNPDFAVWDPKVGAYVGEGEQYDTAIQEFSQRALNGQVSALETQRMHKAPAIILQKARGESPAAKRQVAAAEASKSAANELEEKKARILELMRRRRNRQEAADTDVGADARGA